MVKYILFFVLTVIQVLCAQIIPGLPNPTCAATAEVIGDSIYFIGGANRWSGTIRYPIVYKYDGVSWSFYDSIPDNNVWGIESVVVGNDVYLFAGWPSGARLVRKYDLLNKSWTYLNLSPNVINYGIKVEYLNNYIYLFNTSGSVFEYDLTNDTWQTKTPNSTPGFSLSSVVYNDEIYFAGFYDSTFFKYNPLTDQWIQLANFPFQVSRCAMEIIGDKIYCVGGSEQGSPPSQYDSLLVYDVISDTWSIDQFELSGKRVWMADIFYNNKFYVLGGLDTTSFAVDIVEEVTPMGPIPVELISFTASVNGSDVTLNWSTATETNNRGFEIEGCTISAKRKEFEKIGFVNGNGTTTDPQFYSFNDESLQSGIYQYRLKQINFDGSFEHSNIIEVTVQSPTGFLLFQNYPNPFNPSTKISWQSSVSSWQTLKVYDLLGNEAATLIDEYKPAGSYEIDFNASDLPSGIYFYKLTTGSLTQTRKMLLLK
jgi:N-acetylneuraminic acid mutarotase